MWPFRKNRELVEKHGIRSDGTGGFGIEFTAEEKAWVDADMSMFNGQGIHKDHYDEIMSSWVARSLATYSGSQEREAERANDKALQEECLDKAIAAALKSYNIYPLPIYMYALARLWMLVSREDMARQAYEKFLELQSQFSPSAIATNMLAEWDVEEALCRTRQYLAEGK